MELELTRKQLRRLLDLVYIGNWILNSTRGEDRFKDYDEHLIFESMNEVFDNTYGEPNPAGYQNINAYNQIFVDTVRKTGSNNEKRWLLIPGWNTNIGHTAGDKGFAVPTDSLCTADGNRLMISVHYYDPYNFTMTRILCQQRPSGANTPLRTTTTGVRRTMRIPR